MRKGITVEAAPVVELSGDVTLDDLAREGARRLIEIALRVEVDAYVTRYRDERDAEGHALVVRNGTARPRPITLGAGTVTLAAPRVNDQRVVEGQRQKFTSRILPPYLRRSPNVAGVLPLLYLRGLSTPRRRLGRQAQRGVEAPHGVGLGTVPTIRRAPPQRGQTRTSTVNTAMLYATRRH